MANTGFTIVGAVAEILDGDRAWTNITNILADDGNIGECSSLGATPGGSQSNHLNFTNFGFSIPAGASIDGFIVRLNAWSSSATRVVRASNLQFLKAGSRVGNNISDNADWGSTGQGTEEYGSVIELGGVSWTVADVNASNFGVALQVEPGAAVTQSARARIDTAWIDLYYTEGGGGGSSYVVSAAW